MHQDWSKTPAQALGASLELNLGLDAVAPVLVEAALAALAKCQVEIQWHPGHFRAANLQSPNRELPTQFLRKSCRSPNLGRLKQRLPLQGPGLSREEKRWQCPGEAGQVAAIVLGQALSTTGPGRFREEDAEYSSCLDPSRQEELGLWLLASHSSRGSHRGQVVVEWKEVVAVPWLLNLLPQVADPRSPQLTTCCLPTWSSVGQLAAPAFAQVAVPVEGWVAARVGAQVVVAADGSFSRVEVEAAEAVQEAQLEDVLAVV